MYIAKAEERDLEKIASIHTTCWADVYDFIPEAVHTARSKEYRYAQWYNALQRTESDECLFVLKLDDGEPVGFCYCSPNADKAIEARGELHAAYILPEHRGGVAGLLMMQVMIQHLLKAELNPICLWAFDENPMQRWYQAFGWKPVVSRDRVIAGASIPETGFVIPDPLKLLAHIDRSIAEKSSRMQNQQRCRILLQ